MKLPLREEEKDWVGVTFDIFNSAWQWALEDTNKGN